MEKRISICTAHLLYCLLFSMAVTAQLQKLYIHPKAPGTEKQSQVLGSIRFVPLQQKEDVTVGSPNNVELTENYFMIRSHADKTILLYHKDGHFARKISYAKPGGNFYPTYRQHTDQIIFFGTNKNYALTPKDRIKIELEWNSPRNKKYFKKYLIDLKDSNFILQTAVPEENDIISATHYDKEHYYLGEIKTSDLYRDSLDYELKIYKDKQLVKGFFPYNRINEPRFLHTQEKTWLIKTNKEAIYFLTRPYCDTIYKMINDSVFPAYQLVLPLENTLPGTFFSNPFNNKNDRENFRRNNAWMLHQVVDCYETPRYIYFSIRYLSNHDAYIYRKADNVIFKARNIKPDTSQYNLPLLADFTLTRRGDKFYKLVKAGDLLSFFEQHKEVPVPAELAPFLQTKPQSSTPVIVEFKLEN